MHSANSIPVDPPILKGKRRWESCDKSETMCDDCGQELTVNEGRRWHIENVQKGLKCFMTPGY